MIKNIFILRELSAYLNTVLTGAGLTGVYTHEKNKLILDFVKGEKSYSLEYSIEKNKEYLFLREDFSKSSRNTAKLFDMLSGKKILSVNIFNDDRVIRLSLDGGYEILFSFITSKINCFVVVNDIITDAYKHREDFENKNASVIFAKPPRKPADYRLLKDFVNINYKYFGREYIDEAYFKTGLSENLPYSIENSEKLVKEFENFAALLKSPSFYLYENENNVKMAFFSLERLKNYEQKEYGNINELIKAFVFKTFKKEKYYSVKNSKLNELEKKIEKLDKKIAGLNIQLNQSENSDIYKKYGELILSNAHTISRGDTEVTLEDYSASEIHRIPLKKDLTPAENAQRYFDKYKNQKASITYLQKMIKDLTAEQKKLAAEAENIKKVEDFKEIIKMEKEELKDKKPDETSKFRKFVLSDSYEVWVGKDSVSNDLLTTKYAAPNDLWFHVRGSSGSHTVLKISNKKENPGKEFISKAASIAAYYSKARNASNVPVAYCEKKYVKKKKGLKSGAVIMEREKIIFVKPSLPQQ